MKKHYLLISLAAVMASTTAMALEKVDDVYQISDAQDLVDFAKAVNGGETKANAVLIDDIDMKGVEFPMIGTVDNAYVGTFDGKYHTISNLVIDRPDTDRVGLFSVTNGPASIIQVVLDETCSFTGKDYVGGIAAADLESGGGFWDIKRCVVKATVKGQNHVGAILGSSCGTGNATNILTCEVEKTPVVLPGATGDVFAGAICGWGHFLVVNSCLVIEDATAIAKINAMPPSSVSNSFTKKADDPYFKTYTDAMAKSGELCAALNDNDGKNYWCQIVDLAGVAPQPMPSIMPENREYVVFANGKYRCDGARLEGETYKYSNTDNRELSTHSYKPQEGGFDECEFCHDLDLHMAKDESGKFLVETPADLCMISTIVNNGRMRNINFELPDVLDMAGVDFEPIGTLEHPFYGNCGLNREHSPKPALIKNLVINKPDQDNIGLFGVAHVENGPCCIRGIVMDKSCSFTGHNHVGGIIGFNPNNFLFISNLGNEADVTATGNFAGGIVGYCDGNSALEIKHVYNTGKITAEYMAAGISSRCQIAHLYDGNYNAGEIVVRREPTVNDEPFNGNQDVFNNYNPLTGLIVTCQGNWAVGRQIAVADKNQKISIDGREDLAIDAVKAKDVASGRLANMLNGSAPAYQAGETVDVTAPFDVPEGMYYYQNIDADLEKDAHPVLFADGHYIVASQGSGLRVSYFNVGRPEVTGVEIIIPEENVKDHIYYNLNGVRIARPTTAGVYIMDGKKVYIR